ncbi:MAG: ynfE [Actinomycetia bacterium]|nr:ynfE [Actinomycetes bacterium]
MQVEDGRLVAVDAAPGNPITGGFICQKVKQHARRVYAPERVLTPLRRTGAKGEGSFEPISWDNALDVMAERVQDAVARFGPASVAPYLYSSSAAALQSVLGDRLWRRLRTSRVEHTICAATHGKAYHEMFGSMLSADPLDVVHARLVVVWGANPAISNTHFPPLVAEASRAGARVVVVDPRRTAMAKRADLHLALRPGTDVVLALALARWLDHNDGLDRAFLDAHAEGVDEYLAAAQPFTLDRAAEVCGVDAAAIVAFAELLASTRPAFFRVGWGLERNRNGGSACVSVFALPVLTGQFGVPGSGIMSSLSEAAPFRGPQPSNGTGPPRPPRAPRRVLNMNHLGRWLTDPSFDPPVAVLFVQGSNPAATAPNQQLVHAGLARDDLFTVVHDQVLTDTARFADLVLPATTHFEYADVAVSYGSYVLAEMPAVIDRVGESRTNNEMSAALATRLGFDAADFDPDPGRVVGDALEEGVTGKGVHIVREPSATVQFRDTHPGTPSGRARLAGIDEIGVPQYQELAEAFPLALISPATHRTISSMFGEFNGPEAAVRISAVDAASRGLHDGDTVRVHDAIASVTVAVRVDRDLRPGVASMPKGLWCRTVGEGFTANAFAPDTLSDLAGGATFNDARVEIEKV